MEIPLIARFSQFAANSSSNFTYNRLWKWGALFLALIYAFNRLARIVFKISIHNLHTKSGELSSSSEPIITGYDDDFLSSDDDDGESVDSSCSSEDEDGMREDPTSISCENLAGFYEKFLVEGSGNSDDRSKRKRKFKMRRKRSLGGSAFSFSDFVSGKGVVKIWDGLGLDIGISSVSILDLERRVKIGSIPGRNPAVSEGSVFTTSAGCDGKMGLSSWDVRGRRRTPAVKAEWSGPAGEVRVRSGGVGKVYVRDDVTGKGTIWDVRNAKSPLEDVTENDEGKWWNANGVRQTVDE